MPVQKIVDSITHQRNQLAELLASKDDLETKLRNTTEAVSQLKGSIAALEYVGSLDLQETPKDVEQGNEADPKPPLLKKVKG